MQILKNKHIRWYKKKGGQDRDGIHEAWLMNRFEHADTPTPSHNPYTVA